MSVPRGIPTVTYLRINNNSQSGWVDVVSDGANAVTVLETDKVATIVLLHCNMLIANHDKHFTHSILDTGYEYTLFM